VLHHTRRLTSDVITFNSLLAHRPPNLQRVHAAMRTRRFQAAMGTVVGFQMVPEDPLALSGNALTSPEMVTKKDDQPVDGVAYFQTLGMA